MKKSGAWLARYALEQLGVRHTFGIPGVQNTELYDELNNSASITPLLVSHEGGGAFMADAFSRLGDGVGPHAVPASRNAFAGCDALLAVGTRFAEIATGSSGMPVPADLVHIDINPAVLGANHPARVGYSVPAAIGARLARPEVPVNCIVDDGCFRMTCMEIVTAAPSPRAS